jgi:uncharacterized membrane protein required for colicin V production
MNAFDVFVILMAVILVLVGLLRGLVRISLGLGGLVFGVLAALQWEGTLAVPIERLVRNDAVAHLLAFGLIVVGVILGAVLLAFFLRKLLKKASLSWLDRMLGATGGLLCAALLAGAVAVPLASVLPSESRILRESRLAPVTLEVSLLVVRLAPDDLREKFLEGLDRIKEATT